MFNFKPTDDAATNELFCWMLLEWMREQERTAAKEACSSARCADRSAPALARYEAASEHYEALIRAVNLTIAEMHVVAGFYNEQHDAESIARMIEPVVSPSERNSGIPQIQRGYGSGMAAVETLLARTKKKAATHSRRFGQEAQPATSNAPGP